ncbi:MAG: hypothetical protein ACP5D7_25105 [Limnospira sp.]
MWNGKDCHRFSAPKRLLEGYSRVWHQFESEIRQFVDRLRELAGQLEEC